MKHLVTELKKTCGSCPAQWEGRTASGKTVYIRYRWARFYVMVDGEVVFDWYNSGDSFDGVMSSVRMAELTKDVFEFDPSVSDKW